MKAIKVQELQHDIRVLYAKANTKSQRALLGYMVKLGYARDPIFGGAFSLLCAIEGYAGIYYLIPNTDHDIANEIVHIAEAAMAGLWDEFAFSEREIDTILYQLGNL